MYQLRRCIGAHASPHVLHMRHLAQALNPLCLLCHLCTAACSSVSGALELSLKPGHSLGMSCIGTLQCLCLALQLLSVLLLGCSSCALHTPARTQRCPDLCSSTRLALMSTQHSQAQHQATCLKLVPCSGLLTDEKGMPVC